MPRRSYESQVPRAPDQECFVEMQIDLYQSIRSTGVQFMQY
jgi:hypothetical protein